MPVDVALHEYFRQQAALGSPGSAQFAATRLLALHIGATCVVASAASFLRTRRAALGKKSSLSSAKWSVTEKCGAQLSVQQGGNFGHCRTMTGEVLCSYESEYLLPSPHLGMAQHARVWQPSVPAAMNEHRHCSLDSVSVAAMVLATCSSQMQCDSFSATRVASAVLTVRLHPRFLLYDAANADAVRSVAVGLASVGKQVREQHCLAVCNALVCMPRPIPEYVSPTGGLELLAAGPRARSARSASKSAPLHSLPIAISGGSSQRG